MSIARYSLGGLTSTRRAGIKAYYDCAEDIAKLEAEIREAKKKLEAMLKD